VAASTRAGKILVSNTVNPECDLSDRQRRAMLHAGFQRVEVPVAPQWRRIGCHVPAKWRGIGVTNRYCDLPRDI